MAYLTVEPVSGMGASLRQAAQTFDHPNSKTMVYPPNRARVARAQQEAGSWTDVQPYGASTGAHGLRRMTGYAGLGAMDDVPKWVWWGGGGLVAGLVAGWLFIK